MPEKIPRKEVRRVRREFTVLLDNERDALRSAQRLRRREGESSRKQRKKSWDNEERIARRKFFEETHPGTEKREYMRKLGERRTAFYDQLKAEERQERTALEVEWKTLKDTQRARLISVEEYLKRSERPPPRLLQP